MDRLCDKLFITPKADLKTNGDHGFVCRHEKIQIQKVVDGFVMMMCIVPDNTPTRTYHIAMLIGVV